MSAHGSDASDRSRVAAQLLDDIESLARRVTKVHLDRSPAMVRRYPQAKARCEEDTAHHLRHLAAAFITRRPALFDGYLAWAADLLSASGMDVGHLEDHLRTIIEVAREELGPEVSAPLIELLDGALERLEPARVEPPSLLRTDEPNGRLARDYLTTLLEGERSTGIAAVLQAVEEGLDIETLYLEVLQPALREVGRLWQLGRISVAQEHLVTAATQVAMSTLYPRIAGGPRTGPGVLVASIGGELHEIGARMLADVFELRGWTSHFVGANTPTATVVELARSRRVEVVALSATLSAHVPEVTEVVRQLRAATDAVVLVGGRAFLQLPDLWEATDADGTASDAIGAVELATELVQAA